MAVNTDTAGHHQEYLHIVNKDGVFTEHEIKRLEILRQIFAAAPELQKMLIALDIRQRQEIVALTEQQRQTRASLEADTNIYAAFQNEHQNLERRHDEERDRYVREHQQANDLRREINETQKTLAPDQNHKFSR